MKKVTILTIVAIAFLTLLLTVMILVDRKSGVECQSKARQIRSNTELCYRSNGAPILYGDDSLPIF